MRPVLGTNREFAPADGPVALCGAGAVAIARRASWVWIGRRPKTESQARLLGRVSVGL